MKAETTQMRHLKRSIKGVALVATCALAVAACGSDDESSVNSVAPETGSVTVENAWARTSPMAVTVGVVYMDITASSDDELLSAAVDASIAGTVEIHETVTAMPGGEGEDTSMSGETTGDTVSDEMSGHATGDMSDEMTMRPVESIVLSAGETVMLMPGGFHIMLLDLAAPLEVGQTFDITLTFANAGSKVVTVEVRDEAP